MESFPQDFHEVRWGKEFLVFEQFFKNIRRSFSGALSSKFHKVSIKRVSMVL